MSTIKKILLVMLLGNVSVAWSSVGLTDLDFSALPGDQVEISLTFDGPPPEPKGYVIEKPARISLTFDGTANKLGKKQHSLGVGNARSITVVEAQGRTRLIINMDKLTPYNSHREGNKLFVVVGRTENQKLLAKSAEKPADNLVGVDEPVRGGEANSALENIDLSEVSRVKGKLC